MAERLGGTIYELSPGIYAPLLNGSKVDAAYKELRAQLAAANKRAEEAIEEVAKMDRHRRISLEKTRNGIRICEGLHEKSEACEWEEYVPKSEADDLRQKLAAAEACSVDQRVVDLQGQLEGLRAATLKVCGFLEEDGNTSSMIRELKLIAEGKTE